MTVDRGVSLAWRATRDGVVLAVRLTPRAARDAVDGLATDSAGRAHLVVRVRALPEDGAANKAACAVVAAWLGVPKGAVSVDGGATRREKMLAVAGEPAVLLARLERLAGTAKPR